MKENLKITTLDFKEKGIKKPLGRFIKTCSANPSEEEFMLSKNQCFIVTKTYNLSDSEPFVVLVKEDCIPNVHYEDL